MKRWLVFLMVIGVLALVLAAPAIAQESVYFPTTEWRVSTPEEQGMESARLAAMLNYLIASNDGPNIHNILVIRNGYVVLDASVPPYSTDEPHALYSATKAVVSTLAGVATQQGFIQGYDQSIWDFFDIDDYANVDEFKRAITLADFMTQRSGLGLNAGVGVPFEEADDIRMYEMNSSDADWLQFILDFPMDSEPGTLFRYTDSNPYVVTSALRVATGLPVEEYAEQALFEPLGIRDYVWAISPQGVAWGGDGLMLSAHDLARIGFLYMNGGQWDGQQILSPEWIEAAWTNYFRPFYLDGYGFYWYVYENRGEPFGYAAFGLEGQFLWVFPEQNLIFVTNGDIAYQSKFLYDTFLRYAIESDSPIAADPEGVAQLDIALESFTNPAAVAVSQMPGSAAIDGNVYDLPANGWGWESVQITFGADEASLIIGLRGEQVSLRVGLDGRYQVSETGWPSDPVWQWATNIPLAARGWWQNENEFHVRIRSTGGLQEYELIWNNIADDGTQLRFAAYEMGTGPIPDELVSDFMNLTVRR